MVKQKTLKPWGRFTYEELAKRMKEEPLGTHHRLPRSRADKNTINDEKNLVEIHMHRHMLWHVIVYDKTALEIAFQISKWWERDCIFNGYKMVRCAAVDFEKIKGRKKQGAATNAAMSQCQRLAWGELFGHKTPPNIVFKIINDFLVHPDTPIEYKCKEKDRER